MYDVITIGGATRDIFWVSDDFVVKNGILNLVWGEKRVAKEIYFDIGGGSCNSAVGMSRLGLKTAFWGKVGGDSGGEAVAKRLKEEAVSLQFLVIDEQARTSTSAVLCSPQGDHTIVMYRGGNDDLLQSDPQWDELLKTQWFYLADVASQTEDLTFKIAALAEEKDVNLCFVPGQHQLRLGAEGLKEVFKTSEVLVLNSFEAATLLNMEETQTEEMLAKFFDYGVGLAVITKDVKGSWGFDGKKMYHQEAPKVEVVDTTGAGDSFSSALLAAIVKGKALPEAMAWGAKNAGSVISKFGAQTALLKDL